MTLETIWVPLLGTMFASILASSGLWAVILKRSDRQCAEIKMLKGLGHDRIVSLGSHYIKRGYVTADEYENLHDYLYVPYTALHGNGSAERIMGAVKILPMSISPTQYIKDNENSTKPNDYIK